MPDVVNNLTKLFADVTKLISTIKNRLDIELLQEDINRLVNWAIEWRILFKKGKLKNIIPLLKTKIAILNLNNKTRNSLLFGLNCILSKSYTVILSFMGALH